MFHWKCVHDFDIVCTVHRNQLYKQTNKMDFLYVFILSIFVQLYTLGTTFCFIIRSFHNLLYLQLCTNHADVSDFSNEQLDTSAWFVQSSR